MYVHKQDNNTHSQEVKVYVHHNYMCAIIMHRQIKVQSAVQQKNKQKKVELHTTKNHQNQQFQKHNINSRVIALLMTSTILQHAEMILVLRWSNISTCIQYRCAQSMIIAVPLH